MADPIIIKDLTSGISVDKYFAIKNSCANAKGVNIFSGKRVCLSTHNANNNLTIANDSIPSTIGDIITSRNGYIYDNLGDLIYRLGNTTGYRNIRNYIDHTVNNTDYRYLISTGYIHRYTPNSLYTYSNLDGGGTNRTIDGSYIKHTTGSTSPFNGTNISVSGKQYLLTFTVDNLTSGSFTITNGGATVQTITSDGDYKINFTASNTSGVVITPTSNFDGWITITGMIGTSTMEEGIITLTNTSQLAPVLVNQGDMYVGNGNILIVIDSFGVKYDQVKLPKSQQIVEITNTADYIILWCRDSKNTYIHFWDGVSENVSLTKVWKNDVLQAVENQGDFVIAITGGDKESKRIWKTDGYNRSPIYSIPYGRWSDSSTSLTGELPPIPISFRGDRDSNYNNQSSNITTSFGDMVFLPGNEGVIAYGRRNPSLPFAFVNMFPIENCEYIYCMYAESDTLYVGYENYDLGECVISFKLTDVDILDGLDNSYNYGSRGLVEYLPIVGLVGQEKSGQRIYFGHKTPDNTHIAILSRVNGNNDYCIFVVNIVDNPIIISPTVGSVYKIGTDDRFEVIDVKNKGNYVYVCCKQTMGGYINFNDRQISKVSGIGDNVLTFKDKLYYQLLDIIDSSVELKDRLWDRALPEVYSEIQLASYLVTEDGEYTPEINDLFITYDPK